MAITKRSPMWPNTPQEAHELACAIAHDAANQQMRRAQRHCWDVDDYNLAAHTQGEMYKTFGILNADSWLPDGWKWQLNANGDWQPRRLA